MTLSQIFSARVFIVQSFFILLGRTISHAKMYVALPGFLVVVLVGVRVVLVVPIKLVHALRIEILA